MQDTNAISSTARARCNRMELYNAARDGHGKIVSGLVAAGADVNAARQNGATPLFIAAQNGYFDAVLALVIGGSRALSSRQLARIGWRYRAVRVVLDSPPPSAPLVAARLRLAWSELCHERLGSGCVLELSLIHI